MGILDHRPFSANDAGLERIGRFLGLLTIDAPDYKQHTTDLC